MSREGIEYIASIDGRLDINNLKNRTYAVLKSSSFQNYWRFQSQGTLGNVQAINWSVTVPDVDTYMDRCPLFHITGTISFTGVSAGVGVPFLQMRGARTAPGVNPGTASLDTLRCDPIGNMFTSLNVQINGSANMTNLNLYNRILQRYQRSYEDIQDLSYSPNMGDYSTDYEDLFGFYLDPQGVYGDNQIDPRGAFTGVVLTSNTSTGVADTATVTFDITSPFELSPFAEMRGKGEPVCLKNISTFVVNATLGGRGNGPLGGIFASLWSHNNLNAASGTITATNVSFSSAEILMHYMSPPLGQPLPDLVAYSWSKPTLYQQSAPAIAPGASLTTTSQTIQLDTVPARVYIWGDQVDSLMDATQTDCTPLTIPNISIRYGTQSNLLADMTPQDLWSMSRANGVNVTWNQWNGTLSPQTGHVTGTGAWLCIMPGINFPLPNSACPGLGIRQTMQITATLQNYSSKNVPQSTLNVLVVEEGCMTINGQLVQFSVAMVEGKDIAATQNMEPITHVPSKIVLGGSFWSEIRNFLGKVARPLFNVAKNYLPAPAGQVGEAVLQAYGKGGIGRSRGGAIMTPGQMHLLM